MMASPLPLMVLALTTALAAPPALFPPSASHEDYPVLTSEVIAPQKRAALVLDRLLIALQKALHEDEETKYERPDRDGGPRAAPLRIAHMDDSDMMALNGGSEAEAWQYKPRRDYQLDLRVAPLHTAAIEDDTVQSLHNYESALQRRGQGGGRGRVLRCYFNAITCF